MQETAALVEEGRVLARQAHQLQQQIAAVEAEAAQTTRRIASQGTIQDQPHYYSSSCCTAAAAIGAERHAASGGRVGQRLQSVHAAQAQLQTRAHEALQGRMASLIHTRTALATQ